MVNFRSKEHFMSKTMTLELAQRAATHFNENLEKIESCFDRLSEEEIWQRPNGSSNSMGNLILHLCGNITQYATSSLGRHEDKRERDAEFAALGGLGKEELMQMMRSTVEKANAVFTSLNESELTRERMVQGFSMTGIAVLMHVVEHFSYHTGQIIFYTKQLKDKGFDFYAGHDLNAKNE